MRAHTRRRLNSLLRYHTRDAHVAPDCTRPARPRSSARGALGSRGGRDPICAPPSPAAAESCARRRRPPYSLPTACPLHLWRGPRLAPARLHLCFPRHDDECFPPTHTGLTTLFIKPSSYSFGMPAPADGRARVCLPHTTSHPPTLPRSHHTSRADELLCYPCPSETMTISLRSERQGHVPASPPLLAGPTSTLPSGEMTTTITIFMRVN